MVDILERGNIVQGGQGLNSMEAHLLNSGCEGRNHCSQIWSACKIGFVLSPIFGRICRQAMPACDLQWPCEN